MFVYIRVCICACVFVCDWKLRATLNEVFHTQLLLRATLNEVCFGSVTGDYVQHSMRLHTCKLARAKSRLGIREAA